MAISEPGTPGFVSRPASTLLEGRPGSVPSGHREVVWAKVEVDPDRVRGVERACMQDRRVGPWLLAALTDWALLAGGMTLALLCIENTSNLALQVGAFLAGMWATGILAYRLSILGHDAGHRTVSPNRRLNDGLGNILVFYPALIGLEGYRLFHNEGHHPRGRTSTLRDPEIVLRKLDPFWCLPLGRAAILRRFLFTLFGSALPGMLVFVLFTSTPRVYARFTQFLSMDLLRREGVQAHLMPFRLKNLENTTASVVRDLLAGVALVLFKLAWVILLVWAVSSPFSYANWPLILGMWYGGLATSFWAFFNLRNLFEHVGTSTVQLQEPSPAWKFLVFPHAIWAHLVHHDLPRVPFHRLKDVLRARQAQGIAVRDVAELLATSQRLGPGEVPPRGDERDIMERAAKSGLLGPAV